MALLEYTNKEIDCKKWEYDIERNWKHLPAFLKWKFIVLPLTFQSLRCNLMWGYCWAKSGMKTLLEQIGFLIIVAIIS